MVGVAQRLERRVVAPKVVGSIPIAHPNDIKELQVFVQVPFPVFPLLEYGSESLGSVCVGQILSHYSFHGDTQVR